jgi:hypothetical protein
VYVCVMPMCVAVTVFVFAFVCFCIYVYMYNGKSQRACAGGECERADCLLVSCPGYSSYLNTMLQQYVLQGGQGITQEAFLDLQRRSTLSLAWLYDWPEEAAAGGAHTQHTHTHICRERESHGAHVHVLGACAWGTCMNVLMDTAGMCWWRVCEG